MRKKISKEFYLTIALNTIAAKHRGIRLVVSSRTNGYIQHPLGPDGFEKYNLARITPEKRDAYLGKLNIDAIEFNRQIRDNGLSDMIESVFNFIELVHLWQADGRLPNEAVAMVFHVGDSRAYLMHPGGKMYQITKDHSLVEEMVALGKMERGSEAYRSQKNVITRAVGILPTVDVDMFDIPLQECDYILMCSDGLTNMVPDETIESVLKDADSEEKSEEDVSVDDLFSFSGSNEDTSEDADDEEKSDDEDVSVDDLFSFSGNNEDTSEDADEEKSEDGDVSVDDLFSFSGNNEDTSEDADEEKSEDEDVSADDLFSFSGNNEDTSEDADNEEKSDDEDVSVDDLFSFDGGNEETEETPAEEEPEEVTPPPAEPPKKRGRKKKNDN